MTVALLLISDGRDDYLRECIASAERFLASGPLLPLGSPPAPFARIVWVNDAEHRLGFDGAIREGWAKLRDDPEVTHVFHLEGDFTFNRPVPVEAMVEVLDANPHLVQLALARQPWNDVEAAAGTVLPADGVERTSGSAVWLEHTRNFTTNPSLYPRWLLDYGWPDGVHSEGRFSGYLRWLRPELRFAFWGSRDDGEWVRHIGFERVGVGY